MPLRKRTRSSSSMRRTTSMTEFAAADDCPSAQLQPPDAPLKLLHRHRDQRRAVELAVAAAGKRGGSGGMRNSGDFCVPDMAPFLMACGLCKRRLGPGRDTFIYRGEIAFCSLECRQLHINQDERKEKCSLICMKDTPAPSNGSEDSESYGTAAAA
ncbi:hypothetical protein Cni_G08587 [Canna indica]|uniref:FLZ-type domain-containing protein n=1 Tax=Canna indica TaxID=4628 RepID=A0AAQ3K6D5_9LILI|nr:hypothetical protein Cni_G08587 [Canna indica]